MEPLDDHELNQLLRQWDAPAAPPELRDRIWPRRATWWRWLLTGTIRIPVPVGVAALVLISAWIYAMLAGTPAPITTPAAGVSLADFQPVRRLEPRVVGELR